MLGASLLAARWKRPSATGPEALSLRQKSQATKRCFAQRCVARRCVAQTRRCVWCRCVCGAKLLEIGGWGWHRGARPYQVQIASNGKAGANECGLPGHGTMSVACQAMAL
eukprot:353769-Chlamydomonas_euryale.AAC.2